MTARCRAVTRSYRVARRTVTALTDVDKDFAAGALTVIAGPSGSGKSSLLRILACVERADSGSVRVGEADVAALSRRRRRRLRRDTVAYIYQDPIDNLVEYLSAAEQVRLAARLRRTLLDDAAARETLAALNLEHRADHRPAQLSGGEQQRVAIACAMVGGARLVVADEPTAELDSVAAEQVLDAMRVLASRGAAVVVASHDPRLIGRADHLLALDHGHPVESW